MDPKQFSLSTTTPTPWYHYELTTPRVLEVASDWSLFSSVSAVGDGAPREWSVGASSGFYQDVSPKSQLALIADRPQMWLNICWWFKSLRRPSVLDRWYLESRGKKGSWCWWSVAAHFLANRAAAHAEIKRPFRRMASAHGHSSTLLSNLSFQIFQTLDIPPCHFLLAFLPSSFWAFLAWDFGLALSFSSSLISSSLFFICSLTTWALSRLLSSSFSWEASDSDSYDEDSEAEEPDDDSLRGRAAGLAEPRRLDLVSEEISTGLLAFRNLASDRQESGCNKT